MSKTFLIIDGYNVLHTCGLLPRNVGGAVLEKARTRFIALLNRHLSPEQRRRTTIVFDSQLSDLPAQSTEFDILVEFAVDHPSADERIIQLIRQHSAPKQLVVVSSDHEIQRAANTRRSTAFDSDVWLDQLLETDDELDRPALRKSDSGKPGSVPEKKVEYWLAAMGLTGLELEEIAKPAENDRHATTEPPKHPESNDLFPPDVMAELDELMEGDQDAP